MIMIGHILLSIMGCGIGVWTVGNGMAFAMDPPTNYSHFGKWSARYLRFREKLANFLFSTFIMGSGTLMSFAGLLYFIKKLGIE